MNSKVLTMKFPEGTFKGYRYVLSFFGLMVMDDSNAMSPLTKSEIDVLARLLFYNYKVIQLVEADRGEYIMSSHIRKKIREEMASINGKPISSANISSIISRLKAKMLFNKRILTDQGVLHEELQNIDFNVPFSLSFNIVPSKPKADPIPVSHTDPIIFIPDESKQSDQSQTRVSGNGVDNEGDFDKIQFNLDSDEGIYDHFGEIHPSPFIKSE